MNTTEDIKIELCFIHNVMNFTHLLLSEVYRGTSEIFIGICWEQLSSPLSPKNG